MDSSNIEMERKSLQSPSSAVVVVRPGPRTSKAKAKLWKVLRLRFHILNWIFSYNMKFALNDLIAGITLGLTIIPESIACALLAGLPSHYGLCSAFIGFYIIWHCRLF